MAGVGVEQTRLFWAVNLPASVKIKLADFQTRLREVQADVKWVEQHNLHLTVAFLGGVDNTKIKSIVNTVELAAANSGVFTLELGGVGFFPNLRRPRVVWVGVRGEVDRFHHLHRKVVAGLSKIGFPPESKRFSPHLTLGRIRYPRGNGELLNEVESLTRESPGTLAGVKVATIDLMESKLTCEGPKYSLLASIKLAHSGSP